MAPYKPTRPQTNHVNSRTARQGAIIKPPRSKTQVSDKIMILNPWSFDSLPLQYSQLEVLSTPLV